MLGIYFGDYGLPWVINTEHSSLDCRMRQMRFDDDEGVAADTLHYVGISEEDSSLNEISSSATDQFRSFVFVSIRNVTKPNPDVCGINHSEVHGKWYPNQANTAKWDSGMVSYRGEKLFCTPPCHRSCLHSQTPTQLPVTNGLVLFPWRVPTVVDISHFAVREYLSNTPKVVDVRFCRVF